MQKSISTILIIVLTISMLAGMVSPVYAVNTNEKIVVVIDPGHGGIDGGTNVGIRLEKTYNLLLSQYLAEALRANGNFEVHMTRTNDTYLKYLPRALNIIEHNADVLISMHCNSNTSPYPNGCLAIVSVIDKFDASALAGKLLDAISSTVSLRKTKIDKIEDTGDSLGVYYWNAEKQWDMPSKTSLGQKSDYYSMLTWSSKFGTPSIIIEHGYLSNANDRVVLDSDANLRAIAKAEANAIINFYTGHTHKFSGQKTVDYPSSCTLTGTKSHRCTICGAKFETESLAPAPDAHYWRQDSSTLPTCTKDGFIHYICQISSNLDSKGYPCTVHEYSTVLPAKGHSLDKGEILSDGKVKHKCLTCGSDVIIDPNCTHSFVELSRTDPTCTEKGLIVSKCSLCGAKNEETISPLGHNYIEGDEGFYVCTACDAVGDLIPLPESQDPDDPFSPNESSDSDKTDEPDKSDGSDNEDKERRAVDPMLIVFLSLAIIQLIFAGVVIYLIMKNKRKRRALRNTYIEEPDDIYTDEPDESASTLSQTIARTLSDSLNDDSVSDTSVSDTEAKEPSASSDEQVTDAVEDLIENE